MTRLSHSLDRAAIAEEKLSEVTPQAPKQQTGRDLLFSPVKLRRLESPLK
jgi:hypothetical protein